MFTPFLFSNNLGVLIVILVINPGSTSTKVAVFDLELNKLKDKTLRHSVEELEKFDTIFEQEEFRAEIILKFLEEEGYKLEDIEVFVGRGGPIIPVESGIYEVDEELEYILKNQYQAEHPSLLGGLIAKKLAGKVGKKAYIVDPVSVDEMKEVARFSGLKELPRKSLAHALNIKETIRKFCAEHNVKYEEKKFVVAHLGGGISITAHENGKMVDVNNANDEGPFSPERTGTLPITGLIQMCFSGKYTEKDMLKKVLKKGGLVSYTGTNDALDLENRVKAGDEEAILINEAMAYKISKSIGAYAAAVGGVDYILITGGLARSDVLLDEIKKLVSWIAPIYVYPGEGELEALASAGRRVILGKEKPKKLQRR